jgi:branched-chain amino acid transport system substrate-binding protein
MRSRLTALIGTVLAASGGFGLWAAGKADSGTIHIALTAPITGDYAEYGVNFKRSVEMGIEEINAKGGVLGRKFVLSVGDSKGDPKESATLAQKWTSDSSILAQIGDFTSSCCMASQPIYNRAGMIQLSPTASHTKFAPGSKWSFSIVGTQAYEQPVMAALAVDRLKIKTIAMLYINNDWGVDTQKFFKENFEKRGGRIVATESFFQGEKDFNAVLTKLKQAKPDALYLATMYNDAALISQQREKMGWNLPVLGPSSLYSTQLIQLGGTSVNGLWTNVSFFTKDPDPRIQAYVTSFTKKYGAVPNFHAALAYDSIYILADAIKRAGSVDRNSVRNALAATKDYKGLTGSVTFTPDRDAIKSYKIVQVVKGDFQLK